MAKKRPYGQAHWTFTHETLAEQSAGARVDQRNFDSAFDICALEFSKEAQLTDPNQLVQAVAAIEAARTAVGGSVVVVFAHGWRNNADWDCGNFVSFRRLMASMAKREVERYDGGQHRARRVIGVYLGWEGASDNGLFSEIAHKTFVNYFRRDARARELAASEDFIDALEQLVQVTKDPANGAPDNSPLILAGHSMGGLIMESALAHWMIDNDAHLPGYPQQPSSEESVESAFSLTLNGQLWAGPDLVLRKPAANSSTAPTQ